MTDKKAVEESKRFVCTRWSDGRPRTIRWTTNLGLIFANEGELEFCHRSRAYEPESVSLEELRAYAREFDRAVEEASKFVASTAQNVDV